jgi:hypothetical protein
MTSIISRYLFTLWMVCLCGLTTCAHAQPTKPLPVWEASADDVSKLGKEFSDSQITIRPPKNLQQVELETPPEMAKAGAIVYGWTPGGKFPSAKNLSITLAPYVKPSPEAFDGIVSGFKDSFRRNSESIKFGEVKSGRFRQVECRYGTYTNNIANTEILGFYLVGVDKVGTFAISAMIPKSDASSEEVRLMKASMLTFKRAEDPKAPATEPPAANVKKK